MAELSRRDVLYLIPTGLSHLLFSATPSYLQAQYRCSSTLVHARDHADYRQAYLDEKAKCLPEVVEAITSGMFKGFLYEPPDEKLEVILDGLFSSKFKNKKVVAHLVNRNISSYHQSKDISFALIIPIVDNFGREIPLYAVFLKKFLRKCMLIMNQMLKAQLDMN